MERAGRLLGSGAARGTPPGGGREVAAHARGPARVFGRPAGASVSGGAASHCGETRAITRAAGPRAGDTSGRVENCEPIGRTAEVSPPARD